MKLHVVHTEYVKHFVSR